jgi:periplasmic protein CpxP/Spy
VSIRLSWVVATAALSVSTVAVAQPAPPQGQDRQAWVQQKIAERRAEVSRDLAILLEIKPGQQAALDAFLAATGPESRAPDAEAKPGPAETEPERLDRMSAMAQRRAAQMQTRIEATRTFYAALDPRQRQLFDALMRLRRASHGMRHGDRGGFMTHRG